MLRKAGIDCLKKDLIIRMKLENYKISRIN